MRQILGEETWQITPYGKPWDVQEFELDKRLLDMLLLFIGNLFFGQVSSLVINMQDLLGKYSSLKHCLRY